MKFKKDKKFGPDGVDTISKSSAYSEGLTQMARPRSKNPQRIATWVFWSAVAIILIMPFVNLRVGINNANTANDLRSQLSLTYNPGHKVRFADLGRSIVENWYLKLPSPVTLGEGVNWSSGNDQITTIQVAPPARNKESKDNPNLVVSSIAFVGGSQVASQWQDQENGYQEQLAYHALVNGVSYQIAINLGILDLENMNELPVLLSTPTILPSITLPQAKIGSQADNGWPEVKLNEYSDSVIDSWIKAWTTDDRATLRQITKDENPDHIYYGLPGGWTYVKGSHKVLWSVQKENNLAAVEVQWTMKVPDKSTTNGDRNVVVTGPSQVQVMNLLIQNFDGGGPSVVAWGPSGSYIQLEPGANAVDISQKDVTIPTEAPATESTPQ